MKRYGSTSINIAPWSISYSFQDWRGAS